VLRPSRPLVLRAPLAGALLALLGSATACGDTGTLGETPSTATSAGRGGGGGAAAAGGGATTTALGGGGGATTATGEGGGATSTTTTGHGGATTTTGQGGGAPTCVDDCPAAGTAECAGAGVRHCAVAASGCLAWGEIEPCAANFVCDAATATCREACGDFCDPFSIVLLPDTQNYTRSKYAGQQIYRHQAEWIVKHQKSDAIQFVVHLGDITNDNTKDQWAVADAAHDLLDAAGVAYSMVPGNHDYTSPGEFDRSASLFDDVFGPKRFAKKAYWAGGYGKSNTSNVSLFEVGPMKFMVLSLEYAPRKDVLCWADDQIAAHPDRRVIIATHCYLTHGGGYANGCPEDTVGANGAHVFTELAARHSNVFMVVSGHIGESAHRVVKGHAGNDVHEIIVDYQFEGPCTASKLSSCNDACRAGNHTGNGWLRTMKFDPRTNTVHADTVTVEGNSTKLFPKGQPSFFCSPVYKPGDPDATGGNWYASDPAATDHRYDFTYDMTTPLAYAREDLGKRDFLDRTVNAVGKGDQRAPLVALVPGGAFVAAWEDDSSTADGTKNHDVRLRGFAPGGCAGFAEGFVDPATDGDQASPAMAVDAAGNVVVVWEDDPDDNGVYQIRARGFAADGSVRIPTFTVNSAAKGDQRHPAIAMAPDGRFVVAWEEDPENDGTAQIFVRGFDAAGKPSFADRSVHADAKGTRLAPAIAMDADARFVVAWEDDSDLNGSFQIHARGFLADGSERFPRRTVNSVADGQQRRPAIGASATGAFVVAWEDDPKGDGHYRVLARGFDPQGTATIPDFPLATKAGGLHRAPSVAMAPSGAFAVGWEADGEGVDVHVRTFHPDGSAWLGETKANRLGTGHQRAPHVGFDDTGHLVVAWADDMDGNGANQILARGFDAP
jgi:hypothetical protein